MDAETLEETPEDVAFAAMMRAHSRYIAEQRGGNTFQEWAVASVRYHTLRRATTAAARAEGKAEERARCVKIVEDIAAEYHYTDSTLGSLIDVIKDDSYEPR